MRLIDADKLLEGEHFILKCKSEFGITEMDVFRREVIDNAPTVIWCSKTSEGLPLMDLRSRPQGEWIPTVIDTGLFERSVCREWQCSNCGEVVKMKYPFCHCGADMRKGGRE